MSYMYSDASYSTEEEARFDTLNHIARFNGSYIGNGYVAPTDYPETFVGQLSYHNIVNIYLKRRNYGQTVYGYPNWFAANSDTCRDICGHAGRICKPADMCADNARLTSKSDMESFVEGVKLAKNMTTGTICKEKSSKMDIEALPLFSASSNQCFLDAADTSSCGNYDCDQQVSGHYRICVCGWSGYDYLGLGFCDDSVESPPSSTSAAVATEANCRRMCDEETDCKAFAFVQSRSVYSSNCVRYRNYVEATSLPVTTRQSEVTEHAVCYRKETAIRSPTVPPTASPSSLPPTTLSPTTLSPTTLSPTTLSPTTDSPSEAPTRSPVTRAPSKMPTAAPSTSLSNSDYPDSSSTYGTLRYNNVVNMYFEERNYGYTAYEFPNWFAASGSSCDETCGVAGRVCKEVYEIHVWNSLTELHIATLIIGPNDQVTDEYTMLHLRGASIKAGGVDDYTELRAGEKTSVTAYPTTANTLAPTISDNYMLYFKAEHVANRNDLNGNIGVEVVMHQPATLIGVSRFDSDLQDTYTINVWDASTKTFVENARVGPTDGVVDGYTVASFGSNAVELLLGKRYIFSLRCFEGMPDPFPDHGGTTESVMRQDTLDHIALYMGSVYGGGDDYPEEADEYGRYRNIVNMHLEKRNYGYTAENFTNWFAARSSSCEETCSVAGRVCKESDMCAENSRLSDGDTMTAFARSIVLSEGMSALEPDCSDEERYNGGNHGEVPAFSYHDGQCFISNVDRACDTYSCTHKLDSYTYRACVCGWEEYAFVGVGFCVGESNQESYVRADTLVDSEYGCKALCDTDAECQSFAFSPKVIESVSRTDSTAAEQAAYADYLDDQEDVQNAILVAEEAASYTPVYTAYRQAWENRESAWMLMNSANSENLQSATDAYNEADVNYDDALSALDQAAAASESQEFVDSVDAITQGQEVLDAARSARDKKLIGPALSFLKRKLA
ncbi:hypothetical protein CYMTET_37072 [Cymbomonas tetramitiformis]|uniref:Apple domain-containing protein n=1 Tax=Cymbomonas tetramitiformis TaxID=36881 RepID=A0AAE0CH67_9CHLO|nr:hypothetical protein CYMTET_37072 [Cymbomonas tetramitiformis]